MTEKKSKLKLFADACLTIAQASLVFWVTLFGKGFVYAWVPAMKLTSSFIGSSGGAWTKCLKQDILVTGMDRFFSFLLSTSLTLSMASWISFVQRLGDRSRILFLSATILWAVCFVFTSIYCRFKKIGTKEIMSWLIQRSGLVIGLFLALLILFWYSLTQNIIGWLLLPGLYFQILQFYQKHEKRNTV